MTPLAAILPGFPNADPVGGLIGGILIGLAALLFLLGTGRIAGVSGQFAKTIGLSDSEGRFDAAMFIVGLPVGALVVMLAGGFGDVDYAPLPLLIVAGLLVGFGTRMGSGCTSGHGVCGMSRLSGRSIAATLTFMATGIVTVIVMRMMGLGW